MEKIRDEIAYCIWETITELNSYKADFIKLWKINDKLNDLLKLLDSIEKLIKEHSVN